MDEETQREIASMGGKAAHRSGHAHEFDTDEAREAGRLGGKARWGRYDRELASEFERQEARQGGPMRRSFTPLEEEGHRESSRSYQEDDDRRPRAYDEDDYRPSRSRRYGRTYEAEPARSRHDYSSFEERGSRSSPRYDDEERWPSRRDRDDYEDRPYRRAS